MDILRRQMRTGLLLMLSMTSACSAAGGATQPTATPAEETEMPSSPTLTPKAATRRPTATRYVSPSETPWPTPTASPPLSESGLYLAFMKETEDGRSLVFIDVGGSGGRSSVLLPRAAEYPTDFLGNATPMNGLSPDGRHFAYYTGSIAESDEDPGPNDLALDIMDVEDGKVEKTIPLLSPDFPSDVLRGAEEMAAKPPDESLEGIPASLFYESHRNLLYWGIHASEWSPDSRLLAFTGEMDGPSSDIYTYDVNSKQIARLTDGPGEVLYLAWSPNGERITHGAAFYGAVDSMYHYVVSRDGSITKSFGRAGQHPLGYSDSSWFLVHEIGNSPMQLNALDLQQGGVLRLWPYSFDFGAVALNRQSGLLLVYDPERIIEGYPEPGIYLVDLETDARKLLPLPMPGGELGWWELFEWAGGDRSYPFLATNGAAGTYAVSKDGSIRQLDKGSCRAQLSTNKTFLALYDLTAGSCGGLRIFDKAGDLFRTVAEDPAEKVMWAPNSESLVYVSGNGLLTSRLDGSPPTVLMQAIEEGVDTDSFTWIRR